MQREGLVHHGIELRFDGEGHRIPFDELTGGRGITIYGQQEVVKDLIGARLDAGEPLLFECEDVSVGDIDSDRAIIRFILNGRQRSLECDFIAGCDGFHGVCRDSVPNGELVSYARTYPFGWLGILAEVAPSTDELIYAYHDRGFALHSLRSPQLSRLYVQVDADDDIERWPDERIWDELHIRLSRDDGWTLEEGPIIEKGISEMRSFVAEPMQYGRLYLAGDAVHIVPATGAKGLNLAVADVRVLADALAQWKHHGDDSGLRDYSRNCLRRVWRTQHFACWMTEMLHQFPDDDPYRRKLQREQLEYVCSSRAAATTLAENYVGLEMPVAGHQGGPTG
jgi:p-hydroxybenzoate 3-monooxygenase